MMKYFEDMLEQIYESIKSMDEEMYNLLIRQCEDTVRNGGKIIATGLGKNVPICEKFIGTMNSLGIPSNFLHTNSAMHGDVGIVKSLDLVIMLSKSGDTQESILLAKHLKAKKCKTWLFSFNQEARLGGMLDNELILKLEKEGDKWNLVPNNSTAVYLIVLQGLALLLAERLSVSIEDFKENHPGGKIGEVLRDEY